MSTESADLTGPDFAAGVELSLIPEDGMLLGHALGEPVLLVRRGNETFAIGAICTHYGAPLADGLLVGDTIRCPWHHACFKLGTGEASRAPALDPVSRWRIEEVHDAARQFTPVDKPVGAVFVREKFEPFKRPSLPPSATLPQSVVIVGGGGAGNAAAEMLRHEGYTGKLTMLSADQTAPCDRPNLSKGFLAGTVPPASNPLRSPAFYKQHAIDLKLNALVTAIDTADRFVQLADGTRHHYEALLLATGADPVRLTIPGADMPHVHYLRTQTDSEVISAKALTAKRAVVIGASFIGLEVAASLRARDIDVHVVGTETVLMEKVLGPEIGAYLRQLHETHGVTFHLGTSADTIDEQSVILKNGERLDADLVVIGIGVRPALALAQEAGLAVDKGVTVDVYLETSMPGIFAAGDIARWPNWLSGETARVEHWVVAERQGQTAARNILGMQERFDDVPFFWTEQYDFSLTYVGHADLWDEAELTGSLEKRDCMVSYRLDGQEIAKAAIGRDLAGLRAELTLEQRMAELPEIGASYPPKESRQ